MHLTVGVLLVHYVSGSADEGRVVLLPTFLQRDSRCMDLFCSAGRGVTDSTIGSAQSTRRQRFDGEVEAERQRWLAKGVAVSWCKLALNVCWKLYVPEGDDTPQGSGWRSAAQMR